MSLLAKRLGNATCKEEIEFYAIAARGDKAGKVLSRKL
jgi:hypothetical protein